MTDRRRHRIATLALAALLATGVTGCSLITGQNDRPAGQSADENQDRAAALRDTITEQIPGIEVLGVNYSDDITVSATLLISVRVTDPDAALAAVAGVPIPDLPEFQDPSLPFAPVAARMTQLAWQSDIAPIDSLPVEVKDGSDSAGSNTWDLSLTNEDTGSAIEEAFGPRP